MTAQSVGYFQYYTSGERTPLIKGCDISHYQYDNSPFVINWTTMKTKADYVTMKSGGQITTSFSARYVRFSAIGNSVNTTTTFNEARIFDGSGEILTGRTVTTSNPPTFGTIANFIDADPTTYMVIGAGYQWAKIDLGSAKSLVWINLQLYYTDARIWHNVIIEYSTDNINWTNLYNTSIAGEHAEKLGGINLFKYGGMAVDAKFLTANITAARAAGLKVGAYWFKNPNYYDTTNGWLNSIAHAELEAQQFYDYIVAQLSSTDMGDIMPMLDFENQNGSMYPSVSNDEAYNFIEAFKNKFKVLSGRQIILYTAYYTIETLATAGQQLYHSTKGGIGALLPLNLADYSTIYPSNGYTAWGIFTSNKWVNWQYAASGSQGASYGVTSTDIDEDVLEGAIYTIMPPYTPTGLTTTAGDTQVVLNWSAAIDDSLYFNIYKDGTYLNFVPAATLTYTATGLTNGISYDFQISGTDKWEAGKRTAISSATPLASAAPSGTELAGVIITTTTLTGDFYKAIRGGMTGTVTDMFEFGGKLYILNGSQYLVYGGAGTSAITVAGYRPLLAVGVPPLGGVGVTVGDGLGRLLEQANVLTGQKHETFSPDGTSADFFILEQNVTSIDFVKKNGITLTLTTDYTVDLTLGKVHFVAIPATGTPSNIDVGWTKGIGQRTLIEGCRFEMEFSGKTDSRVFLWGNTTFKNRRFWSGLAAGVPDASYFESNSFDDLGTGQYAISDIVKQLDRQKIFFELGGGAMFSYYESSIDAIGNVQVSFPVYELNENISNAAFHQVQVVNNRPYTLNRGIYSWNPSTVRDQTNAVLISQRVKESLDAVDLSTAITYDWQEAKEYWLNIGSIVWVHNYFNDTWYKFDNITASCFLVINGEMYYGTDGAIEKFETGLRNDNGAAIPVYWEQGFYDFGADWRLKYINRAWIAINSSYRTSLDVRYVTNEDAGILNTQQTISFNILTFKHINFAHFSFDTSYNPQPFAIDIDVQKFIYFKFILSKNDPATTVTVLSINMLGRLGGKL
jgi:GH25 family lysozyme M1 (1,4-beta-N-acetylmuramidase)